METARISRRQLLDVLQSVSGVSVDARGNEPVLPFEADTEFVEIVWRERRGKGLTPGLIIIEKKKQRDFFAWVSTFVPMLRPFSAFFRVIGPEMIDSLSESNIRSIPPKLTSALVGIVAAEAMASRMSSRTGGRPTARDCLGTISFCLARTLVLGVRSPAQEVIEDWSTAKELIENTQSAFSGEVRFLWDVVNSIEDLNARFDLSQEQERILACCLDIRDDGNISDHNWREFTNRLPELGNIGTLIDGTREDRVIFFERLLGDMTRTSQLSRNIKAFLCGYLTSLIAPGTLDHFALLAQVIQTLPISALWYGLCAGLRSREGVHNYAGGIGQRVLRELLRCGNLTDVPTCDIGVGELSVLVGNSRTIPDWLRANGPFVAVEIAPTVVCLLRYSDPSRDSVGGPTAVSPNDLRRVYDRLEDIVLRVAELQRDLQKMSGNQISSRETKPKPRNYPR
jgi:hypothetical protein